MQPTIQNGNHDSWRQRIFKEQRHSVKYFINLVYQKVNSEMYRIRYD